MILMYQPDLVVFSESEHLGERGEHYDQEQLGGQREPTENKRKIVYIFLIAIWQMFLVK